MTDRRSFLSGIMLAPVAAAPAMAMTATPSLDPVAAYWAAWHGINDGIVSEDAFAQAMDALDYWEPTTQRDFIRKVVTMFHDFDAPPPDDRVALMIAQGKRFVGEA